MPPTRILLCRHGETDWNREGRYQGVQDIPLNAKGREQARQLALGLAPIRIDASYSSPLSRALETATIIVQEQMRRRIEDVRAGGTATPPLNHEVDAGLREISHGQWEGRLASEFAAQEPAAMAAWQAAPHTVHWPGGETLADVQARAVPALERITRANPGTIVLVVAHDAVNKALLLWAANAPLARFWAFKQDSTCLNAIDVELQPDGSLTPVIALMNSVAHTGKLFGELVHKAL